MQIKFKPEENHFDTCLLEDSDEDGETDEPVCLNSDLGYDESD